MYAQQLTSMLQWRWMWKFGCGCMVFDAIWSSKGHYGFTSWIVVKMAWEGIQFIGQGLEGWRVKMQGWVKA